ncbi:MAG: ice-binding family protein, partial [Victivallales bacterium]
TVTATNAVGTGLASAKSNEVTPVTSRLPVDLGTAGDFVILAKTGVSTTGVTAVLGDIGISPAAASFITGFGLVADASNVFSTSSLVTGNIYAANYAVPTPANMTTAISDMETAYTDAAGRTLPTATELGAGDITSMTLAPGLYKWSTGVLVSAAGVTLAGSATDVWIFQIAQNLDLASGAAVTLIGGAKAENVFWQVAGQTTLNTTASMQGIVLCQTAIVMKSGATLDGRALAQTAVTLIANNVNSPVPVSTIATVTSGTYTVSPGSGPAETIINVPASTVKAVFLAALAKGQVNQTWNSAGISATVITGDTLVVMAQDKTTVITYTVTVNP